MDVEKQKRVLSPADIILGSVIAFIITISICFVVFGPRMILDGSKAFYWRKQNCAVEKSDFDPKQTDPPALLVSLRYEFEGKQYNVTHRWSDSQAHLQRQASLFFRPGDEILCRINPDNPAELILDKEYTLFEFFLILSIAIMIICIITAMVLLWLTLTRKNRKAVKFRFLTRKAIILACSGFVVIAAGTASIFGITDAFRMIRTYGWAQVDATIKTSGYSEVRDGELWNYKYNLRYSYEFEGKKYESGRWSLFDKEVTTQKDMRKALDILKLGDVVPCYVNPANPDQAVLERRWKSFLGLAIVPIIVLFAAYYFCQTLREKETSEEGLDDEDAADVK